jgi:hypothetical protein
MDMHSPRALRRLERRFAAGARITLEVRRSRAPCRGHLLAGYETRRLWLGIIESLKVGMVHVIPIGITEIFSHYYGHAWLNVKKGAYLRRAVYCSSKRVS